MGTIYFLLIVTVLISGTLLVIRRINVNSYLHGSLEEARVCRKAVVKEPEKQAVSSRERKYVEWYLENGHRRQDIGSAGPIPQPSTMVGVAFLTNDLGMQRRASNG